MQHIKPLVLAFSFASLITVPAMGMEDPGKKHPQKFPPQEIPLQEIATQEQSLSAASPQLPLKTTLPASSPSITILNPRLRGSASEDSASENSASEGPTSDDDSPVTDDESPKSTSSIPQNLRSKSLLQQSIKKPLEEDIFNLDLSDED